MAPTKIMLIRHGEKQATPPPYGVDEDGTQDKHSLTVRGWQRAGALVPFFTSPVETAIATPTTIYASKVASDSIMIDGEDVGKSLRPQETVIPLARRLNLTLKTSCAVGQEDWLAKDIRSRSDVVLVAWEHKHIPLIASPFNAGAPNAWPDNRFDVVWVLDREDDSTYRFTQLNQSLLDGDQ